MLRRILPCRPVRSVWKSVPSNQVIISRTGDSSSVVQFNLYLGKAFKLIEFSSFFFALFLYSCAGMTCSFLAPCRDFELEVSEGKLTMPVTLPLLFNRASDVYAVVHAGCSNLQDGQVLC